MRPCFKSKGKQVNKTSVAASHGRQLIPGGWDSSASFSSLTSESPVWEIVALNTSVVSVMAKTLDTVFTEISHAHISCYILQAGILGNTFILNSTELPFASKDTMNRRKERINHVSAAKVGG